MGKTLVIIGADFSNVSIDVLEDKVIDFSTATVKYYNIAESDNAVRLIAPTSGNPSFYMVDCSGYDKLVISVNTGRLFIAKSELPSSADLENIESYFAGTKEESYYSALTGTNTEINLPPASRYLYIRKTITNGTDNTPSSATLKDS